MPMLASPVVFLASFAFAAAAPQADADVRRALDTVLARLAAVERENKTLRARVEKLEFVPTRPAQPTEVEAAKAAPSPFDAHLERSRALNEGVRTFGHLAVNTWDGQANVPLRAGAHGTTNVWDAAVGVAAKVGPDTALRMRAFTVLPSIGGEGDGFGNGRAYAYLRDAYIATGRLFGVDALNLRLGRMPYALGDEAAQFDAPDNPLVSHSAAFFWGYDEGAQLFGTLGGGISYTLTLNADGQVGNGSDDTDSKARGLKVAGDHGHWHWSGSVMNTGDNRIAELWMGAQPVTPVGLFSATGAPGGSSPSRTVSSEWAEADGRYEFKHGHIAAAYGRGHVEDESLPQGRSFGWAKVEPMWWFSSHWYVAARWSELHVRDPLLGYALRPFESGSGDLAFDVNELERTSIGVGYRGGERLVYKLEHTGDRFTLIPGALPHTPGPERRDYTVLQAAAEF
jgi:hypothetical protein